MLKKTPFFRLKSCLFMPYFLGISSFYVLIRGQPEIAHVGHWHSHWNDRSAYLEITI